MAVLKTAQTTPGPQPKIPVSVSQQGANLVIRQAIADAEKALYYQAAQDLSEDGQAAFYQFIQQNPNSTWRERFDYARTLPAQRSPAPRSVPAGGPDLTRKGPGYSGRPTVETYKSMSPEERRKLTPEQIDALSEQALRRNL